MTKVDPPAAETTKAPEKTDDTTTSDPTRPAGHHADRPDRRPTRRTPPATTDPTTPPTTTDPTTPVDRRPNRDHDARRPRRRRHRDRTPARPAPVTPATTAPTGDTTRVTPRARSDDRHRRSRGDDAVRARRPVTSRRTRPGRLGRSRRSTRRRSTCRIRWAALVDKRPRADPADGEPGLPVENADAPSSSSASGVQAAGKHSSGQTTTGSVREVYPTGKHSTGLYAEGRHAAIARAHGSTADADVTADPRRRQHADPVTCRAGSPAGAPVPAGHRPGRAAPVDGRFGGLSGRGYDGVPFSPCKGACFPHGHHTRWSSRQVRRPRPHLRRRAAAAERVRRHPLRGQHPVPGQPQHRGEHPAAVQRDGHRHRGPDGDRDGPPGRPRRPAPQPLDRGPGPAGRPGQALRVRHDRAADHHRPGRQHRRGRRALRAVPDLRRAGGRQRRRPGRHRDEPRHAVRERPVPPGARGDDPAAADHRQAGHLRRRRDGAAEQAQGREAAAGRRGRQADRPDHAEGLRQARPVPAVHQGRHRPAAWSVPRSASSARPTSAR